MSEHVRGLFGVYGEPDLALEPSPLERFVAWLESPDPARWAELRDAARATVARAREQLQGLVPRAGFAEARGSFERTLEILATMQAQLNSAEQPGQLDVSEWRDFLHSLQAERERWLSWEGQRLCPNCEALNADTLTRCESCGGVLPDPEDRALDLRESEGVLPSDVAQLRDRLLLWSQGAGEKELLLWLETLTGRYRQAARLSQRPVLGAHQTQLAAFQSMAEEFERAAAITSRMGTLPLQRERLDSQYRELCACLARVNRQAASVRG